MWFHSSKLLIISFLINLTLSLNTTNIYNYTTSPKLKGVALGGWFVLEPYITPSLFQAFNASEIPVDEYHYCLALGREEAETRLTNHWSTFYNESDFVKMSQYGLNMVRIPIGYWAFELVNGDPYVQGQEFYLDQAIQWSQENDLSVWIDLHGVPGSQNGFDNSGYRGLIDWQKNSSNIETTSSVLQYIFDKYAQSNYSNVIGVEIVNEPLGPSLNMTELKSFYTDSYKSMRESNSTNNIVLHDAFQSIGYWDSFMSNDSYNIVIDHHHYEVFTVSQLNSSIDQHISNIQNYGESIQKETKNAVVGEWSAALTDCVPWLNGVGLGARYNGTYENNEYIGTCKNITNIKKWGSDFKEDTRRFIEVQLDSYTSAGGWVFWCWKTETTIDWDFQRLVEYNLMPQPLSDREYNSSGAKISSSGGVKTENNAVKVVYLLVGQVFFMSLFI